MAVQIKRSTALSMLSLTPLMDVIFLLLVFFLVASRFAEEDRDLDVQLPSASEARPMTVKPKEMFVGIDADGNLFLGNRATDVEDLETSLRAAAINNPTTQSVVIRADKRCIWDRVVSVIDICHRAGIHDVRPTTAPAQ